MYSRLGNEPPHQGALPGILELLRSVRQVGDERLEVEIGVPTGSMESHAVSLQLRIDRLAILLGGEEAEAGSPSQLRLTVAGRHRHFDVVGVDGVLLGKMPDLQTKRISADAGGDPAVHADRAPGTTHPFLPRLPFLQRFQWTHAAPDAYPSTVPSVQAASKRELSKCAVEAGLVVDLVGRQVGDDVFYAPAAAMASGRPVGAFQATKMGAQARDLAVVDRERISAFWIELVCACRVPALPPPSPILAGLRSPPGPPARHSSRPMSSRSPSRRLPGTATLLHQRSARGTPLPGAHPQEGREILVSSARVFSRRPSSPSPSFYDRRPT